MAAGGKRVTRVDSLTDAQRAAMDGHADWWIEVGLRTGRSDRARFEAAVADCYRFAGLEPPKRVVWVGSPLVVALAGPIAAALIGGAVGDAVGGAVGGAVGDAVGDAVGRAVSDAVGDAVGRAVSDAVSGAVDGAVCDAVGDAVGRAVGDAVSGAVDGAVSDAVSGAVDGAVDGAVGDAVGRAWFRYIGGQFWVGGWWWGPAYVSFFRDHCRLDLPGDLWDRAAAYAATCETASWWWPHRDFVIVAEHPNEIHRELVNPDRPRGWRSHRLHNPSGPSIAFADGWALHHWHGVAVTADIIAGRFTADDVMAEGNAERRRAMAEIKGWGWVLDNLAAEKVAVDEWGTLWRFDPGDGGPVVHLVDVLNSTPEPDGSIKRYVLRVPPEVGSPVEALAWTCDVDVATYRGMAVMS